MKRNKLFLTFIISTITTSLLFSGCAGKGKDAANSKVDSNFNQTGLPITKEKTTLKIAAKKRFDVKSFDELEFFKKLEEKTNVKIEWDMSSNESWKEKIGLIMASNDLPDAFFGMDVLNDTDLVRYGSQGLVVPIEGLVEKYGEHIKKALNDSPEYKKQIAAPDGHIYGVPSIVESSPLIGDVLFINKQWLDAVGKPVPKTTDEFYETLKAFKGKDLNKNGKEDEMPFTFKFGETGMFSMFGSFGLLDNAQHIAVRDKKVVFTAVQPEFKEAIKYFNKLFSEGLVDQESFTQDEKVKLAKIKSKQRVLGAYTGWSLNAAFGTKDVEYVPMEPLTNPKGEKLWNSQGSKMLSKGSFCITSQCKKPEVAIRWADQMYEKDTGNQAKWGMFDVAIKKNDQGKLEFITPPKGMTSAELTHSKAPGVSSMGVCTKEMLDEFKSLTPSLTEKADLDKMYKSFVPKETYPKLLFKPEESEKLSSLQIDLIAYVDQTYAKWMMKGGIDSEWDAYVKKLNDMGLNEMIKILQQAYDRYNSR